jgi:hypothetical protein
VDADPADDLRLLNLHVESVFALAASGRILRQGPPDNAEGPRLFFGGCAGGNVLRLRHDVGAPVARTARALADVEPPWTDPAVEPGCLPALADLLDAPAKRAPALIYRLPHGLILAAVTTIVRSGTAAGDQLLARLAEDGMPAHLVEAGFVGLDDFWEPWCAALVEGRIAALAFAARNGARALDVGVHTFPGYRGQGLATAVTAAWSSLPDLADRALFYSTHTTNRSSRRVAARLGLRRFGLSVSVF